MLLPPHVHLFPLLAHDHPVHDLAPLLLYGELGQLQTPGPADHLHTQGEDIGQRSKINIQMMKN